MCWHNSHKVDYKCSTGNIKKYINTKEQMKTHRKEIIRTHTLEITELIIA
jgi:hypothetical protein